MTTYNTGNPLGSSDPKDLYDNAQNLDTAVNSTDLTFNDRLGVQRKTYAGLEDMVEGPVNSALAYRNEASASASSASADALVAQTAAEASGDVVFYDTYALANAAVGSLPDLQVVEIFVDETKNNERTRYRKEGGVLVFKVYLTDVTQRLRSTAFRNLMNYADAYLPAALLPSQCLLQKLRTDFLEYCIYYPISVDGIRWARSHFTNKFSVNGAQIARHAFTTLSMLYKRFEKARLASNSTGVEAQAATVNQATAARTAQVGTFTGPATQGGVTDIIYSITPGDYREYTIPSVNEIALRTYTSTVNGGVVQVTIVNDATSIEIDAEDYLIPLVSGKRLLDLRLATSLQIIRLARGLPTATYRVRFTVDTSNPVNGRGYDGGVRGYTTLSNIIEGRNGTFLDNTLGGVSYGLANYYGARVVYLVENCTNIYWTYYANSNCGIAEVRVYDSTGVEVAPDKYQIVSNKVDMFGGGGPIERLIVDNLTRGDYYLVITNLPEKNASATQFRLYDDGVVFIDRAEGGTLGVDPFDNLGVIDSPGSLNLPDNTTFIGFGNLELAIKVANPASPGNPADFVGVGAHGFEDPVGSPVFKADGVVIDFAGAAINSTWIAGRFDVEFDTQLKFPYSGAPYWADVSNKITVSKIGYTSEVTHTVTSEASVTEDYTLMLNVPNTTGGTFSSGVDGGFKNWAVDGDGNATLETPGTTTNFRLSKGAAVWTQNYAVVAEQISMFLTRQPNQYLNPTLAYGSSFIETRSDGTSKYYNDLYGGTVTLPVGLVTKTTKRYRCFYGTDFEQLFAAV